MLTSEVSPIPVAISRFALFLPFLVVILVVFATGRASPGELAMTLPLLMIPAAIYVMRKRAHR